MKLRALRLWNVRRFGGRGIALENIGDGVNVLSAANEQGKSTCFDALHALFFQPHSGTAAPVRALRPYSGGSPRIEADIETPEGQFRVAKQYYAGKQASVTDIANGRLIAQADAAEAWIGALMRGGGNGPTGLLWVRQGVTEIGAGTAKEKDDQFKAREDMLASVAGEVEALTGGRRMVQVMARCEADLDRLVTSTGRPKTGGPYHLAIEQRDKLLTEEDKLKVQLEALREALDERRKKRERLKALNDPEAQAARRADQQRTATALETAKAHAGKLETAIADEKLASLHHATAADNLRHYDEDLARVTNLTEKRAAQQQAIDEAKRAHQSAGDKDARVATAIGVAEAKVETARNTLDQAQAAQRAREAKQQLGEAEERLARAETARSLFEKLSAVESASTISDERVEQLERLQQQIAVMRASADASAVSVSVGYEEGKQGSISLEGKPLTSGEAHRIDATTRFQIADIGTLTISPGTTESDEKSVAALREAEEEWRRLLAEAGVESLAMARTRQEEARKRAAELREAQITLEALAPEGIEQLRTSVTRLQGISGDADAEVPDTAEAQKKLEELVAAHKEIAGGREVTQARLNTAYQAGVTAQSALTATQDALAQAEERLGPAEGRTAERASLASRVEHTTKALAGAKARLEALQEEAPDLESAQAAAERAASVVQRADKDAATLEKEISELTGRITTYAGDAVEEQFEEVTAKRQAAEQRVAAYESEVAALSRLKYALEEARSAAKEQYFGPVVEELKPLLAMLLDNASVTFDEETLLPQHLERDGQAEDVAVLSGGMREQLAILTRLAFARLLAKGGQPVPVILDDALAYCDDDRIERMFDALHRQARDLQILVFTCRQRAFEKLGGQGLQMVEWTPEPGH